MYLILLILRPIFSSHLLKKIYLKATMFYIISVLSWVLSSHFWVFSNPNMYCSLMSYIFSSSFLVCFEIVGYGFIPLREHISLACFSCLPGCYSAPHSLLSYNNLDLTSILFCCLFLYRIVFLNFLEWGTVQDSFFITSQSTLLSCFLMFKNRAACFLRLPSFQPPVVFFLILLSLSCSIFILLPAAIPQVETLSR